MYLGDVLEGGVEELEALAAHLLELHSTDARRLAQTVHLLLHFLKLLQRLFIPLCSVEIGLQEAR